MIESALSIALLAVAIWASRVMIPSALRSRDGLAITCAALTAALALLGWLFLGVSLR